jgi:hypothetical protein
MQANREDVDKCLFHLMAEDNTWGQEPLIVHRHLRQKTDQADRFPDYMHSTDFGRSRDDVYQSNRLLNTHTSE